MNKIHIHEILRMIIEENKTYTSKTDFVQNISEKFGDKTLFFACSADNININAAYDFLIQKGKITVSNQNIGIAENITMCDDDKH